MSDTNWLEQMQKEKIEEKSMKKFVISETDLIAKDIPPIEWLFKKLIPSPALIGIVGKPGCFKTLFVQWMARRLSMGLDLFDQPSPFFGCKRPIKTLIVEREMGESIVQERSKELQSHNSDNVYWMMEGEFNFQDEKKIDELASIVDELDIELLVFDPFSSVTRVENENDNSQIAKVMDTILSRFVTGGKKINVIFIHHPAKSSGEGDVVRGAGDILGKSYVALVLSKENEEGTIVNVKCVKHRWIVPKAFRMNYNATKIGEYKFEYLGENKKEDKATNISEDIISMLKLHGALKRNDLMKKMGRKGAANDDKTFSESVKRLIESGTVLQDKQTWELLLK